MNNGYCEKARFHIDEEFMLKINKDIENYNTLLYIINIGNGLRLE